jgi:hypothetical protein
MDPMTIAAILESVGKYGPAIANFFGGKKMAGDETDLAEERQREAEAKYDSLKANMPQYGVGSAWNKYLSMSTQDPAADLQRQIASQQEATNISALKSGGPKSLFALPEATRLATETRMGIEADSHKRQQEALKTYAGVEQRADDKNKNLGQRIDLNEMLQSMEAGQSAQDMKDQMRRFGSLANIQGLSSLLGGAGDLAKSFDGSGEGFDFKSLFKKLV